MFSPVTGWHFAVPIRIAAFQRSVPRLQPGIFYGDGLGGGLSSWWTIIIPKKIWFMGHPQLPWRIVMFECNCGRIIQIPCLWTIVPMKFRKDGHLDAFSATPKAHSFFWRVTWHYQGSQHPLRSSSLLHLPNEHGDRPDSSTNRDLAGR